MSHVGLYVMFTNNCRKYVTTTYITQIQTTEQTRDMQLVVGRYATVWNALFSPQVHPVTEFVL